MTGAILSGGKATRFSGENKSFLQVNGTPIIDLQFKLFKKLFDEVIIVTNDCTPYLNYDAVIVNDIIKGKGPLGGIYTALFHAKSDLTFVAACDMPFLNENLIRYMISNIGKAWVHTLKDEPLHTIYSKKCLRVIEKMLANNELKISMLFDNVWHKTMDIEEVKKIDPQLNSFKNINTNMDLEAANSIKSQVIPKTTCNVTKIRLPRRLRSSQ